MNLADVLDRATDRIDSPRLGSAALAAAARRQARTRVVLASAAAVAVVVSTASVLSAQGGDESPGPALTPTPSITPSGSAEPTSAIDPDEQKLWDPLTLGEASVRDAGLPEQIDPPSDPPSVNDLPMDAAVVAWPREGEDLRVLGTDGRWRYVPGTSDAEPSTWWWANVDLSSDGRYVAMATEEGILVADVTSGERRVLPWPAAVSGPWDSPPGVRWLPGDDSLAVFWDRTWTVSLDGNVRAAPFAGRDNGDSIAIDPDGAVVENQWRSDELVAWDGDDVTSRVYFPYQGQRFVSRYGRIAFTTGSMGGYPRGGPVAADVATGELLAYAPIRDPHAIYSDNGHLTAMGFLDADTVVYLVGPAARADRRLVVDEWHLVAWDLRTGEFERITTGSGGMRTIDVATGLLGAG